MCGHWHLCLRQRCSVPLHARRPPDGRRGKHECPSFPTEVCSLPAITKAPPPSHLLPGAPAAKGRLKLLGSAANLAFTSSRCAAPAASLLFAPTHAESLRMTRHTSAGTAHIADVSTGSLGRHSDESNSRWLLMKQCNAHEDTAGSKEAVVARAGCLEPFLGLRKSHSFPKVNSSEETT